MCLGRSLFVRLINVAVLNLVGTTICRRDISEYEGYQISCFSHY